MRLAGTCTVRLCGRIGILVFHMIDQHGLALVVPDGGASWQFKLWMAWVSELQRGNLYHSLVLSGRTLSDSFDRQDGACACACTRIHACRIHVGTRHSRYIEKAIRKRKRTGSCCLDLYGDRDTFKKRETRREEAYSGFEHSPFFVKNQHSGIFFRLYSWRNSHTTPTDTRGQKQKEQKGEENIIR